MKPKDELGSTHEWVSSFNGGILLCWREYVLSYSIKCSCFFGKEGEILVFSF